MVTFKTPREKRLWIYVFLIILAIASSLIFGEPIIAFLSNQNIQAVIFLLGMLLIGATSIVYGLKSKPRLIEWTIWLGFSAVYLMAFLRLGLSERSHLIEYGVLAIFIHMALLERSHQIRPSWSIALQAFLVTFIIGVLDECIQLLMPNRVFDPVDILFNGSAAFFVIGVSFLIQWLRARRGKSKFIDSEF